MSWECRYLNETHCNKRNKECHPGDRGCVLEGRFFFPFDDANNKPKRSVKAAKKSTAEAAESKPVNK
ncbi:MAG: hypothetical protein K6A31_11330 [Fibrobacter sp.]|jgi:hypothetical protein|nr:hypothetical protein [Fibrobacter sp.]